MSSRILIKNICMVNEGQKTITDLLIQNERIQTIAPHISEPADTIIDGSGRLLLPGVIDGQVHFREPGLTHKGNMYTESKAAVAGGVTSFIDMPNTVPNVLDMDKLQEKYDIAAKQSLANFGFFLGVNGQNVDDILRLDTSGLLAVSDDGLYFTGKGNLLADQPDIMQKLFAGCQTIIAIHAEREQLIEENEAHYRGLYGEDVPVACHPLIRSERACYEASQRAIALADAQHARLHILHLTTEAETHLFRNDIPLREKRITTEVCVQNLWFCDEDYARLGTRIKWNPAIKTAKDREGLLKALLDDRIDLITTDHAPHLLSEKERPYFQAMSGAPMVQHALTVMLELHHRGQITLEKIVEKMCHNPAVLYRIADRGFIREGCYADLVIVDPSREWTVQKENVWYACGWSPLEGETFHHSVTHTFVNGRPVFTDGTFDERWRGQALLKQQSG